MTTTTQATRDGSELAIQTTALTKVYGSDVRAVDGLDLSVKRGEVYGFLGPNGAGKTTTLRMLLGLIYPTSGTAVVLDRPPGDPEGLVRVGAIVEEPAFYPFLSGRDNLRVVARIAGLPDDGIETALGAVDLLARGQHRFKTYSQGMRQRLGVAAALLKEPDLLILDEPTNGLDPAGMADMRSLIRSLGSGGRTVLLSSHLLGEVQQICDRVVVIDRGLVIADDTVTAIRDRPGTTALDVWATPPDTAGRILSALTGTAPVVAGEGDDRHWHLETAPDDIPELVRALVEAGIDVHEIRRERQTLESVFFALTAHEDDQEES